MNHANDKKSITITDIQNDWLRSELANGNYATDSEIIREALREKQIRTEEINIIRAKLEEAELSGFTDLTVEEILEKSKAELRANGDL